VTSRIQKREYFDMAMDSLRITDAALRRELWQSLKRGGEGKDIEHSIIRRRPRKPTIAEQRLLELLFTKENLREAILAMLEPSDYEDLMTAEIFKGFIELTRQGEGIDFESLRAKIGADEVLSDVIAGLFLDGATKWDSRELHAANQQLTPEECVFGFRVMKIQDQLEQLNSAFADAERAQDADRLAALSMEHLALTRRRNELALAQTSSAK
jgi:hypothetical protein